MQAHPLSIPAALIPFQSAPSTQPAAASRSSQGLHRGSGSDLNPPRRFPSVPRSAIPAPGIAQGSGLAHDAGNLLGALGLYCDLLRVPGVLRPEHRHYATELGLISSRSSDLIRRLLTHTLAMPVSPAEDHPSSVPSSYRTGHTPEHPVALPTAFRWQPSGVPQTAETPSLNHASVLRNLAPVLQRIAAGTATVSVHAPAVLPPLDLPVEAMERITVNLVRNAVEAIRKQQSDETCEASHTPGEIRVTLGIVAGRLQLLVEDNGPGVPPPVAAAFMNPGALPANAHRGLGHRIVHDLVTSSGGRIAIRTRPGHGTVFCIKWPLTAQPSGTTESEGSLLTSHLSTAALGSTSVPTAQKGLASC